MLTEQVDPGEIRKARSASVTVKIDKTAPVISGMPKAGCLVSTDSNQNGDNQGGNVIEIAMVTAADVLSGLAPGSLKVTGTSNQPYTLTATAADPAGNSTTVTGSCTAPNGENGRSE